MNYMTTKSEVIADIAIAVCAAVSIMVGSNARHQDVLHPQSETLQGLPPILRRLQRRVV